MILFIFMLAGLSGQTRASTVTGEIMEDRGQLYIDQSMDRTEKRLMVRIFVSPISKATADELESVAEDAPDNKVILSGTLISPTSFQVESFERVLPLAPVPANRLVEQINKD